MEAMGGRSDDGKSRRVCPQQPLGHLSSAPTQEDSCQKPEQMQASPPWLPYPAWSMGDRQRQHCHWMAGSIWADWKCTGDINRKFIWQVSTKERVKDTPRPSGFAYSVPGWRRSQVHEGHQGSRSWCSGGWAFSGPNSTGSAKAVPYPPQVKPPFTDYSWSCRRMAIAFVQGQRIKPVDGRTSRHHAWSSYGKDPSQELAPYTWERIGKCRSPSAMGRASWTLHHGPASADKAVDVDSTSSAHVVGHDICGHPISLLLHCQTIACRMSGPRERSSRGCKSLEDSRNCLWGFPIQHDPDAGSAAVHRFKDG